MIRAPQGFLPCSMVQKRIPKMSQKLFYLILNKEEAGPYTLGQLQSMWRSGQVTAKTHFWSEGQPDWERLLTMASILDAVPDSQAAAQKKLPESPRSEYVCPQCGSENIQSARNLYEGGTATSVSATRGIGVGADASGYDLMGGRAVTMKKQQTLLASRHAPPVLPELSQTGPALLAVVGLIAAGFSYLLLANIPEEVDKAWTEVIVAFGIIMFLAAIAMGVARVREHEAMRPIFEKRKAKWTRSYLCNKCGFFGELNGDKFI